MNGGPFQATTLEQPTKDTNLGSLASQVVSVLADRREAPLTSSADAWIRKLASAAQNPDRKAVLHCVDGMVAAGVPADIVLSTLIPEAARKLGAGWVANKMSFAEVTVGSARLQSAIRHEALMPRHDVANEGQAIVMTPPGETHTLGAITLAAQLRRCKMSVEVCLDPRQSDIRRAARSEADFIAISCATDEALGTLSTTIREMTSVSEHAPLLAVGGSAITRNPNIQLEEVRLISNDLTSLMSLRRPSGARS